MNERHPSSTALSPDEVVRPEEHPTVLPPAPPAPRGRSGSSAGRAVAIVVGSLLIFMSLVLLGSGGTAMWVDLFKRDEAGFLTTDAQRFSATGSALTTRPTELGPAGIGWLYSPGLLDQVRIRVTPTDPNSTLFVGIGPTTEVDRYLAGVRHTLITDFWSGRVQAVGGGASVAAPDTQEFWVTSESGRGPRSLEWDPIEGSWTVVVMNANGQAGIDLVTTDLGATVPALVWVAFGVLVAGGVFLVGGVLLIAGAIRRGRVPARTV